MDFISRCKFKLHMNAPTNGTCRTSINHKDPIFDMVKLKNIINCCMLIKKKKIHATI